MNISHVNLENDNMNNWHSAVVAVEYQADSGLFMNTVHVHLVSVHGYNFVTTIIAIMLAVSGQLNM